jgi:hypothetical protein
LPLRLVSKYTVKEVTDRFSNFYPPVSDMHIVKLGHRQHLGDTISPENWTQTDNEDAASMGISIT